MNYDDIWTYIISFNNDEIREIKLITYTQGEIFLRKKEDISNFIVSLRK